MLQNPTNQDRKAQADWLLQEANEQFDQNQLQAALDKCQQALAIYREIGDRQGEDRSLATIISAYAYITGWT